MVPRIYKTTGEMWSGNLGRNGIRPFMEYYANQVASALIGNMRHYIIYGISTKFNFSEDSNLIPYVFCCCCFTNEQYGFLSAHDAGVDIQSLFDMSKGHSDMQLQLREMLLLDSIILNTDRHTGNFGILVNNDTYVWHKLAPIFDQDCSLGFDTSLVGFDTLEEAYEHALIKQPKTSSEGYIEQGKRALNNHLAIKLKSMYPFHFKRLLDKSKDLVDERIEFMEFIVNTQIKRILQ